MHKFIRSTLLVASLALALTACQSAPRTNSAANVGDSSSFEAGRDPSAAPGCRLGAVTLPINSRYPSTDGCNTCTCMGGGGSDPGLACTELFCGHRPVPAGCQLDLLVIPNGSRVPASDGCNTCTCTPNGLMCTELNCGPGVRPARPAVDPTAGCRFNGGFIPVGRSVPAGDGCNSCTCSSRGGVYCTELACGDRGPMIHPPRPGVTPAPGCEFGGRKLRLNERVPAGDGCNTCVCTASGGVACTEMYCGGGRSGAPGAERGCTHGQRKLKVGQTVRDSDGCNFCTCRPDGSVSCTEIACR